MAENHQLLDMEIDMTAVIRIPECCPVCAEFPKSIEISHCWNCGYEFPLSYVIPYAEQWDLTEDLLEELEKYQGLRLLGRFIGKNKDAIAFLHQVKYLYLSRYKGFQFEFLKNQKNLNTIELDLTPIISLNGVEEIQNLSVLKLIECRKLENIQALSKSKSIKVLDLRLCNRISDFSPVGTMSQLRVFCTDSYKMDSLDFLRTLPELNSLGLFGNKKVKLDVEIFQNLPQLKFFGTCRKILSKTAIEKLKTWCPKCEVVTF